MTAEKTVNLITELERRYLECNICSELFDEDKRVPRLLPCQHSFCSKCLKRLGHRKDTIKCPSCNAVYNVKKNGPSDFPKDNTRRDLTSFLQTHSDRNAFKKCCGCGHTVDINYECQQCALNFCGMCRQQHIAENKTHSFVVSNSETFQGKEENLNICPIPHHERAKFKYFCNSANCQSVLCPFCALDEHRDINKHEIEDIEEAFKRKKKQLGRLIEFIQSKILNVESILQNVKDNMFTLKYDRNEFQKQLDDMCNRGFLVLQNRRQIILDKYDFSLQRKEFKANLRNDTLRNFLENANACCYLGEKMINCNNMCTFLNGQQTVEDHIKRYINDPVEDSTYDKNDFEEIIDFDDYLQSFNMTSFLELAKEKQKQSLWTKTKNAVHILKALLLDTIPEVPNDEVVYPVWRDEIFDAHYEREESRRINERQREANRRINGRQRKANRRINRRQREANRRINNRRTLPLEQIIRFALQFPMLFMLSMMAFCVIIIVIFGEHGN